MLTVFSSFAEDILLDSDRHELKRQVGGPAHFIRRVLTELGAPFELVASTPAQVELVMTEAGETHTKLVAKAAAFTPRFADLASPAVLISTTINEIQLNRMEEFPGRVFLDVQGYVRNPEDSSKQRLWEEGTSLASIFCLKATQREAGFLPEELLARQKQKLMIITKGADGLELYVEGKRHDIRPREVVTARDTIGAGDTFLASFAHAYMQTKDPLQSADMAMEAVRKFLLSKPTLETLGI